jgi:hypothetical protein
VQNEFTIKGDTAYVVLPNRIDERRDTIVGAIDRDDFPLMDEATTSWWYYAAPGHEPPGAYLLCNSKHDVISLARLLLHATSPKMYRAFKDGDSLNCRRSNLVLMSRMPLQADWLWSAPLPEGFTVVRKMETSIVVRASAGADPHLMWQYLLERWQWCRSKNIRIVLRRAHQGETPQKQRITAIIDLGDHIVSYDIGEDGACEFEERKVRDIWEMAA